MYIVSSFGWSVNEDGERFDVGAGTALPLLPHSPHAYSPHRESGWIEYWLGCDGSHPQWPAKESAFGMLRRPIPVGMDSALLADFRHLCLAAHSDNNKSTMVRVLGGLINRLLGRVLVLRHGRDRLERSESGIVERVLAFLDSRHESDIAQQDLSALTGLSYRRLSQIFKTAVGMSPHQYFVDRKIKAAARLLRSGTPVKDVANRLNFDSPYYFSRLLKSKTGASPSSLIPGKQG
ncbi:MAG: AraC family transcriptional regulator [Planctomycetota bacterium]|nr:AraC family transcriptional regulator [Planctomycetota bacterium]